jgi:hypothetical protein
MTYSPVADCRSCRHSIDSQLGLWCVLQDGLAEILCLKFERENGSDVEEYIELQDGHVSPVMGRGD